MLVTECVFDAASENGHHDQGAPAPPEVLARAAIPVPTTMNMTAAMLATLIQLLDHFILATF
jgi:hypothetical protein